MSSHLDLGHGVPSIALFDYSGQTYFVAAVSAHQYAGSGPGVVGAVVFGVLSATGSPMVMQVHELPGALGTCGVAMADLGYIEAPSYWNLIVTTFYGDVFIYDVGTSGILPTPRQSLRLEGALGLQGSIVIDAPGPQPDDRDIYISGSLGLWRLRKN